MATTNKTIRGIFDQRRDIYRSIEKVITYNVSREDRLKAEISEYVVTQSIEDQLERLLTKMQTAMDSGVENEIGVWVSGFYGSGKSSFTKYLGLALDDRCVIDGIPFMSYLQDRLQKPQTKALLSTVAKRFPAAVVMLDLASEMLAGATMEDVSTVLYYKVLQWAGYSRNLKVAAFERKLKKDGRYDEFTSLIQKDLEVEWPSVQNDPLVVDSLLPEIAHQMYPNVFKTPTAFTTETSDFFEFENERVNEMLDIVREASGREYIIFIVDEVGQYVGSRPNLILNLDGLAKNLKALGNGKAWIMGTAQQTLTEDDPRAALNSPMLYKLKDRFPIQVDLESSDIREICYRRLLGKSPDGEGVLTDLFQRCGQELRFNTRLQDARYYDSDFDATTFVNLYPFLPAHFDILLHLLGALAKSTGGIGLRSAIKVIQDILIEDNNGRPPVADQTIGWLATTVTLYDALEKDIQRAFRSVYQAVAKVGIRFHGSPIHENVAKTVAVLQILGNMPITSRNVASLMHPGVESASGYDAVQNAINELIADPIVPFGEQDGNLRFFSEKLNDIELERTQIPLRSIETRRILNEALRDVFHPLPSTRLNGTLSVTAGLKVQNDTSSVSLAGERETIQIVAQLVDPADYETARTRLIDDSRQRLSQFTIFLLGRTAPETEDRVAEIYRCREICQRYRTDPDQEIKDYCTAQSSRADTLSNDLKRLLTHSLGGGSFIFRGQATSVDTLDSSVLDASKKYLSSAAAEVFDRYSEAPVRVETALPERFLRIGSNMTAITSELDPLGLVRVNAGTPSVKTDDKAITSIRDYISRNGNVDGKRLMEHFSGAPFGWSQDTLRYLLAAMLLAGELKLKVSGHEITVNGQQAIEALKTNNSFRTVGVALREERPSIEVLSRASERLTDLVGDTVVPLEDDISKKAADYLKQFQSKYAPVGEKLRNLGLPGVDDLETLGSSISDILLGDASDAPAQFGAEESPLFDSLKWVTDVDRHFRQGLETVISDLLLHSREIRALPDLGVPGKLREDLSEDLQQLDERLETKDFWKEQSSFNTLLTHIRARTRDAAIEMSKAQQERVRMAETDLNSLPEWSELTQEEQSSVLAQIEALHIDAPQDLAGLRKLINQEFVVHATLQDVRARIVSIGGERVRQKEEERLEKAKQGNVFVKSVSVASSITSIQDLNALLEMLEQVRAEALKHEKLDIRFEFSIRADDNEGDEL